MVTIRRYEDRDMEAVVDIVETVFAEYGFGWEPDGYCSDLFEIPARYQHENACFWVGEVDGEVVGCGGLLFFPPIPGGRGEVVDFEGDRRIGGTDCEVVRLYVHPRGRRKGLGTALFERLLLSAKQRGCKSMEIWSDTTLHDAHRMYERYGAKKVGQRICPPPDLMPEYGMVLEID